MVINDQTVVEVEGFERRHIAIFVIGPAIVGSVAFFIDSGFPVDIIHINIRQVAFFIINPLCACHTISISLGGDKVRRVVVLPDHISTVVVDNLNRGNPFIVDRHIAVSVYIRLPHQEVAVVVSHTLSAIRAGNNTGDWFAVDTIIHYFYLTAQAVILALEACRRIAFLSNQLIV